MKTGCFLFNKFFIQSLEENLHQQDDIKIISFDKAAGDFLMNKRSLPCVYIDDYFTPEELEEHHHKAILWLQHWSQAQIINHISIAEFYKIDVSSLWWISGHLYLYSDIINLISLMEIIDHIISKEHFEKLIIPAVNHFSSLSSQLSRSDYVYPYKILFEICKTRNIPVATVSIHLTDRLKWRWRKVQNRCSTFVFDKFYWKFIILYRKLQVQFNISREQRKSLYGKCQKKIIMLSPSQSWGTVFDLQSYRKIAGDSKIGYLYQKLHLNPAYAVLGIDCNSLPSGEFNNLKKKIETEKYIPWSSLEYVANVKTLCHAFSLKRLYQKKSRRVLTDGDFKASFQYRGIHFHRLLESRLRFVFQTLLPCGAVVVALYKNLLQKLQPDLLIISYETGLHGRAATSASFKYKVPVLALQHGKIHPTHPQYIHLNTSTRRAPDVCFPPIADATCVFGEYTKKVLTTDSAYPEDNISITGQPLTDAVTLSDKLYHKENFLKGHKFDPKQPLICLISQNFDAASDYDKLFQITCEGLNYFPKINFLIKLHPGNDIDVAQATIKKYYKNYQQAAIVKAIDLYEILFNSDIVITGNSTVGLEAMIFRKPLITIEGFKYSMKYAESGASIGVTSDIELRNALHAIFTDEATKEKLIQHGQNYLRFHLFKIDGNATERIIEKAEELMDSFRR